MSWTTSILTLFISLLSITTTASAKFNFPSTTTSFYTTMLTTVIQSLDLTNCPFRDSITLPDSSLPDPSDGLTLKYITLGRGTQNYTCATDTNLTTPEATGATATLFDASCLAALGTDSGDDDSENQSPLHILPDTLTTIPLSSVDFFASLLKRSTGQDLILGRHYFTADGVPFFDLRSSDTSKSASQKYIAAKKDDEMDAPAKPGYGITGDVAWLKLSAVEGGLQEVYRVHTAGGAAPDTCEGMPEVFTVDYTSEYWFYG